MKVVQQSTIGVILALSIAFLHSCKKNETETAVKETIKKDTYNQKSEDGLCKSDWFPHSKTQNPKEGKGSPFDAKETTNAIFHQWSWQKFLWLTKPQYEIEKLNVIVDGQEKPLYIGETLPLFLNPKEMLQVDSHFGSVASQPGATVVLEDTAQAGSSGILKTNPQYNSDNNKEETVFYSIHVSPSYKVAAEKFKDAILSGSLKKNNTASFPVGSLELKVSWVNVNAIPKEKRKDYYTTVGAIANGKGEFVNTEVALLGMHVVGVVENHPEFIWATFEHDDLAPNYDWKANQASTDSDKLLFAKGTTTGIDGIYWDSKTKQAKEPYKAYDLFQYGVPRDKTGEFMETAQSEQINFNNIEEINSCVKENLAKEEGPWKNYFYNGSIWMDTDGFTPEQQATIIVGLRGQIDSGFPQSFARGSLNCANVTMETYTQTFKDSLSQINAGNLANCFSCHNGANFKTNNSSPLYMSHIFNAYVKRAEGKTFEEVELLKAKQELEEYTKNRLE